MFTIIEMDGFGYPMVDLLFTVVFSKGKDMYETSKTIMSTENVHKEIDEKIYNANGLSRMELDENFKKKEMELGKNYVDVLGIYWITMFYISIYPVGIVQSFLNLLFKFIIEKNFLLNVYKRPEFINPQIGFFCFNFFNFGYFLFLCGNLIFFRNEYNKKSLGGVYIVIMILILILPFYLLAKLISYLTNFCCLKEKEKNIDEIKNKFKTDYRIFNPCSQKEKIISIFKEFKDKKLLTDSQFEEFEKKLDDLNDLNFYYFQIKLRAPKIMTFEEKLVDCGNLIEHDSKIVKEEDKEKLYYFLMQLGFMNYLEEGNILKPKKKRIEFYDEKKIESIDLKNLSMQENLSNSDSGYFITFDDKNELIMAYVDNERDVKILDVFKKKVINNVKDLNHTEKIVCVDYFTLLINNVKIRYLITIALDNKMIISNLTINEKNTSKQILNIGDNYNIKNLNENHFSISTVRHEQSIWIITSYNFDPHFKIFDSSGAYLYKVEYNQNIISLEGLFYTEENTYICVRTSKSIGLYINQFIIRRFDIVNQNEDKYINFKLVSTTDIINVKKFLLISTIDKNLTSYSIDIYDISNIFPLFTQLVNNIFS